MTPRALRPVTSATMSSKGRLTSGAAHLGDDAEGAGVVTPHLDGDPGRVGQLADGRQGHGELGLPLGRGGVEDLDDGPVGRGLAQQRRGPGQVVGPEHDVDVPGALANGVAVALGQATSHGDLHARVGSHGAP